MGKKISVEENKVRKTQLIKLFSLDVSKKEDVIFLNSLKRQFGASKNNVFLTIEYVKGKITDAMKSYGWSLEKTLSKARIYSSILTKNHSVFINGFCKFYNLDVIKAKKVINNYTAIIGYNHKDKLKIIKNTLNISELDAKKVFLIYPSIYSNFINKYENIKNIYNISDAIARKLILNYPQFISFDHENKIKTIGNEYGVNRDKIIERIIATPRFISTNFTESLTANKRLGKLFGLSEKDVKQISWEYYRFSTKGTGRKIAMVDAIRESKGIIINMRKYVLDRNTNVQLSPEKINKQIVLYIIKWLNGSGKDASPYILIDKFKQKYPKGVRTSVAKRLLESPLSEKFKRSKFSKKPK